MRIINTVYIDIFKNNLKREIFQDIREYISEVQRPLPFIAIDVNIYLIPWINNKKWLMKWKMTEN